MAQWVWTLMTGLALGVLIGFAVGRFTRWFAR